MYELLKPSWSYIKAVMTAEKLSNEFEILFARLRVPTVSLNQKVHNINVALESLRASPAGLPSGGNITAKDIVQGHREKTLELIWHLIFGFGQAKVLDEASLENELAFLRKSLAYRVQIKDPAAVAGQVWTLITIYSYLLFHGK